MTKYAVKRYETEVLIPSNLDEAYSLFKNGGSFVSGGTLLQIGWEAGNEKPKQLISLHTIPSLRGIKQITEDGNDYVEIGAMTTLTECNRSSLVKEYATLLSTACSNIGSPAIRNRGTIGGNICCKVGDTVPALLALNSKVAIFDGDEEKVISLNDFVNNHGFVSTDVLLTKVIIPVSDDKNFFFKKMGRRESFVAAVVTVSGFVLVQDDKIDNLRLAVGGGAHAAYRLTEVEVLLKNQNPKEIDWSTIQEKIVQFCETYSDSFITENYRKRIVANVMVAYLQKITIG